jgi:hypothetical protein
MKASRFIYLGKAVFEGEIQNRQDEYNRKTDSVSFKSKFNVRLEQGFFATEIIPPQPFPLDNFHIHQENGNMVSFCELTINKDIKNDWNIQNIPPNMGQLDGQNIKTDWFEWT